MATTCTVVFTKQTNGDMHVTSTDQPTFVMDVPNSTRQVKQIIEALASLLAVQLTIA